MGHRHPNSKNLRLLFVIATLVLIGYFAGYQIALAVKGEGSATVDGGGNATVERAVSHTFTVLLTVGASGITVDAANPTFTLPAGFTAPSATPVATAGDVVSDGQWSAIGGATCPVTMGSSGASGQVMTVDVTTVCTVGPGGTITLTYKGTSAATMGATALTIMTADDAGVPTPAIALTGGSPTITVTDTVAPTVTVTMDDAVLNVGDTSLVTFTFSEAPTGFTTDDVTVANGSIGAIDTTNPLVQTATYTPTSDITDATNVISVGTVWTDASSNTGVGDDSPNYTIDTAAPTVTVTMSDATLTVGETALVTFTFSEAPTGFTTDDVTVANGSIGAIDTTNPLVQTATYTPTSGITDATNVITVGTGWTDASSNTGVGDDSPNYTITTVPSSASYEHYGTINVVRVVVNDNGGTKVIADFPLFVNGTPVISGVTNSFEAPASAYVVTEISDPNYTSVFSGGCDASGHIGLNPGDNKFCTITNDDIGALVVIPPVPPLIHVTTIPIPIPILSPVTLPAPVAVVVAVVVAVPGLPNTGLSPEEKSIPWNILIPSGIFAALSLLYVIRKQKTV